MPDSELSQIVVVSGSAQSSNPELIAQPWVYFKKDSRQSVRFQIWLALGMHLYWKTSSRDSARERQFRIAHTYVSDTDSWIIRALNVPNFLQWWIDTMWNPAPRRLRDFHSAKKLRFKRLGKNTTWHDLNSLVRPFDENNDYGLELSREILEVRFLLIIIIRAGLCIFDKALRMTGLEVSDPQSGHADVQQNSQNQPCDNSLKLVLLFRERSTRDLFKEEILKRLMPSNLLFHDMKSEAREKLRRSLRIRLYPTVSLTHSVAEETVDEANADESKDTIDEASMPNSGLVRLIDDHEFFIKLIVSGLAIIAAAVAIHIHLSKPKNDWFPVIPLLIAIFAYGQLLILCTRILIMISERRRGIHNFKIYINTVHDIHEELVDTLCLMSNHVPRLSDFQMKNALEVREELLNVLGTMERFFMHRDYAIFTPFSIKGSFRISWAYTNSFFRAIFKENLTNSWRDVAVIEDKIARLKDNVASISQINLILQTASNGR